MIKRFIITLFLTYLAINSFAGHNLKIDFRNGSSIVFILNNKPTLSFQNRCLEVNKDTKTTFSFDDIVNYHVTESMGTSIHNSSSLNILLVNNETLQVKNAHPGSSISLTSATGNVVSKAKIGPDGKADVKIPDRAGVFVLSAGFQSLKIIRK